uniref:Reverse transcriptase domain-containing protein n=1 Tax=Tanacetum cinerariifolium TaxID=118510 RepID=A0A6L2NAY6_TANCI|nr:reverse transcriptase domain-containing protein [Tanacetum cinerariifolium]
MTTLAEFIIVADDENHPPMLDKEMYNSWESHSQIRKKKYSELTEQEKLQDDCDVQETNIILQGLVVLVFLLGGDPIACLNKAMAFMSTVVASCFPSTNNQLRTSSNLQNQATIQDGRCERHMARQCTHRKRPRNDAWFKVKLMLAKAQNSGQVLDEEQLAFLTDDLDAYDSNYDDISSAKVVLMANLLSYSSDILSEVVKVRTTPDAITEGSSGFEHTNKVFKEEVIPFINSLRASFKDFENGLHNELNKVKMVFNQMEAPVKQCSLDKLDAKDVSITNLRKHIKKLKGKNVVEKDVQLNNPNVIAPGMFKLDLAHLAPKLLNSKDAHINYIKHSREHADILRKIVKYARALRPLDSDFSSAYKIVKRIQEVLVYVKDTCPSLTIPSEKLVDVTPLNKNKKVRFTEATTSSSNTQKQCMRTRSSSNLSSESPQNPSSSNPKCRNRRRSKQPFILKESHVDTMADQRTMAELLRAPTEGFAEAIVVPSILAEQFELKHSLIDMMTSDQFFGLEKDNPHDYIRWFNKITSTIKYKDVPNSAIKLMLFPFSLSEAARGNLLERRTQDVLTIIENKSKVRNSRNKSIVSQIKSSDANSSSSSEIAKLTHAVNQQTSDVTTAMTAILKQFQATPPPAFVQVVEEICVTCGGAHPYYQCLAAGGTTFSKLQDNIQGYVLAATVNYN